MGATGSDGATNGTPTPLLDRLLAGYVQQYVMADLASMAAIDPLGGCGYAMIGTALAAMELLGLLTRPEAYDPEAGDKGFGYYWRECFAKVRPAYRMNGVSTLFRDLFRHGIAHSAMSKGGAAITKARPDLHMTVEDDTLTVDCTQFVADFMDSYAHHFVTSLADDEVRSRADAHAEAFFDDAESAVNAQHRRTIERLGKARRPTTT